MSGDTLMPFAPNASKFFVLQQPLVQQPQQPEKVSMEPVVIQSPGPTPPAVEQQQPAPVAAETVQSPQAVPVTVKVPVNIELVPGVGSPVGVAQPPVVPDIAAVPQPHPEPVLVDIPQPPATTDQQPAQVDTPVELFDLLVQNASDIKIVHYPSFVPGICAYVDIYLLVVVEIYAVVRCTASGLLRGNPTLDQLKLLSSNKSIGIVNDSFADMRLVYKDDPTQVISVTGNCADGSMLINNVHQFAASYAEELQHAVEDNQNVVLFRRFTEVLQKEGTAVREWLAEFPVGLLK